MKRPALVLLQELRLPAEMFGLAAFTAVIKAKRDHPGEIWRETRRINRSLQTVASVLGIYAR